MIVVDDRLLFDVLAGTESTQLLELAAGGVATTFSWYYRLARAVSTGRVDGSLTREFAALGDARRSYVHGLLENLPDDIEILHPRDLVPSMSSLAAHTTVNFLTAEAISTAMIISGAIVVSTRSALIDRAAALAGVECLVLPRT